MTKNVWLEEKKKELLQQRENSVLNVRPCGQCLTCDDLITINQETNNQGKLNFT